MFRRPEKGAFTFTEGCRQALSQARRQAHRLSHEYVGTEHILLALLRFPDDEVAALIEELALTVRHVVRDVETETPSSRRAPSVEDLPYTSRAKKVLELAMSEARAGAQTGVGTGHLFLALIREEKGIAAQVLRKHGVTYAAARSALNGDSLGHTKRFSVQIDDTAERSIYEQIVAQVQEAIATGRLEPNERLATVRELADELDIAPGTVARAYSELERLGVVVTDGARGTRVASRAVRPETLVGLLRPVAVAAFHLGASAPEVRQALEHAMRDIFPTAPPP